MCGHVEVVEVIINFVIDKNIDLNSRDNAQRTGYFNACAYPSDNRRKISHILRENAERIGLDLNIRDVFTNLTGEEMIIRSEREKRDFQTTNFVCMTGCCHYFNPYPNNFPKTPDVEEDAMEGLLFVDEDAIEVIEID